MYIICNTDIGICECENVLKYTGTKIFRCSELINFTTIKSPIFVLTVYFKGYKMCQLKIFYFFVFENFPFKVLESNDLRPQTKSVDGIIIPQK